MHNQQIKIAFNMILLLCISSIVLGEMPQQKSSREKDIDCTHVVEDITLTSMIVYIGTNGLHCPDTLIIEDINLRVKRGGCKESPVGCGGYDQRRTGRALLTNTDTLLYNCGGSAFWWIKGTGSSEAFYRAIIDSVSLRRLNDILDAFEMSPASCMPEFRRNGESFTFCVIFQSWIIFNNYHKEDLDAALQVECGGACRRGAQEGVVA